MDWSEKNLFIFQHVSLKEVKLPRIWIINVFIFNNFNKIIKILKMKEKSFLEEKCEEIWTLRYIERRMRVMHMLLSLSSESNGI